jgi:hypothetical protein
MKALLLLSVLVVLPACDSKPPDSGTTSAGAASVAGSSNGSAGTSAASGNGAGGSAGSNVAGNGTGGGSGTGGSNEPPFTTSELLVNGDAEQGATGWTASGPESSIEAEEYGAPDFPAATDPSPITRGNHFFRGSANPNVDAHQEIDVTPFAARIATGLHFKIQAHLGGYADQDDHASIVIRLLAADGTALDTSTLGGPLAAERLGMTGLVGCSLDGKLPEATRRIDVHLVMRRAGGTGNDGYADNLSLVLHD